MSDLTLAIDVGGTKIAAGLVDADGTLVHAARTPTPDGSADTVFAAVEALIGDVAAKGAYRAVGVGSAGPIDLRAGTVSPVNIPEWRGFPLRARLEQATDVPVRLAGDGVCMALGEQWTGAARDAQFVLGMVVSTGVGGGLVLDGAPYDGRTGNAGHVGHVVIETGDDALACPCGGRGCVETIASGPRMAAWARANGWLADDTAGAKELADNARAGDPPAQRAFARGTTALAAMITSVGVVCDLDLVVIGGGVAKAGAVLFDPLRAALRRHARIEFLRDLRVEAATLGDDAGIVGAAALWR